MSLPVSNLASTNINIPSYRGTADATFGQHVHVFDRSPYRTLRLVVVMSLHRDHLKLKNVYISSYS